MGPNSHYGAGNKGYNYSNFISDERKIINFDSGIDMHETMYESARNEIKHTGLLLNIIY